MRRGRQKDDGVATQTQTSGLRRALVEGGLLHLFLAVRRAGLFAADFFARASPFDWMACALTMAPINPGKRCSISAQRDVLCISTPRRSPRISPASLSSLKC